MRWLFLLSLIACNCHPAPPPPVPPNTTISGAQLCGHLNQIGCTQLSDCETTYNKFQNTLSDFKPDCLMAATNVTEAQACKTTTCH